MQMFVAIVLLLYAVFQSVPRLQAKLAVRHGPKSSEMLSNALYNQQHDNNNNNSLFDNDLSAYNLAMDDDEHERYFFNVVEQSDNNNNNNKNTNQREQSASDTGDDTIEEEEYAEDVEELALFADYHDEADAVAAAADDESDDAGGKLKARAAANEAQTNNNNNNSKQKSTTTKANTLTKLHANSKWHSSSKATTTTDAAAELLQLTPYNNNDDNNNNRASSRPHSFANPFGQLGALFGSDQLHLQDYTFLFNPARHTVFQLHTAHAAGKGLTAAAAESERVLHAVSDSIGAAFGASMPAAGGAPAMRVEEVQLYNASSLRQSRFNPFNPTRILIHGWFGGAHAGVYNTLIPEYLRLGAGNYNVFTVDWGRGAIADYITASYRVKPVGKVVAQFIDFLHEEAGISYDDLHVIGFSMGAHVAGIAGKFVQTGRLPVIYALDPALPFFRYERIEERISLVDADYVEVIHTSVGSYGYDQPLGHVDFYMNYGSNQPGCFFNECSHMRAYQVFAESLRSAVGFHGQGCDVQLWRDMTKHRRCLTGTGLQMTMGGDPKNVSALRGRGGVYNIITNANAPYAKTI